MHRNAKDSGRFVRFIQTAFSRAGGFAFIIVSLFILSFVFVEASACFRDVFLLEEGDGVVTGVTRTESAGTQSALASTITYEYVVSSTTYTGIFPNERSFSAPRCQSQILKEDHATGARIEVFYDEDNPEYSTLEVIFEPWIFVFLIWTMPFLAFGISDAFFPGKQKRTFLLGVKVVFGAHPTLVVYLIFSIAASLLYVISCNFASWKALSVAGAFLLFFAIPVSSIVVGKKIQKAASTHGRENADGNLTP